MRRIGVRSTRDGSSRRDVRPAVLRALLASVVVTCAMAVLPPPATAQTSDVELTIDPTVRATGLVAVTTGRVSCSSTTVDGSEPLSATIQQGSVELHSDLSRVFCDPATGEGTWAAAVLNASQLRPGNASVAVQLTLDDGTNVSATGSVRVVNPNVPVRSASRMDITLVDEAISSVCGFPVQVHDVGLVQNFRFTDAVVENFVGTSTFTNLNTGTFVVVESSNRTKFSSCSMTFVGLNYRIWTSTGSLVSSGRGVLTAEGEDATPHLTHLLSVLCGLLRF